MDGHDRLGAARTDALAPLLVARAAPIRFDVARTAADRDAVYRLRCQVIVEQGWAPAARFPGGRERDADDDRAVHVVAWDGAVLAATARLVFPSPGRRLPTEELFDLAIEPRGRVVNIDRLAIAPAYRDRGHRLLIALLFRLWLEARPRGIQVSAGVSEAAMIRLYRFLGFRPEILGPARRVWGEERFPLRVDGAGGNPAVIERLAGIRRPAPAGGAVLSRPLAGVSARRHPR